MVEEFSNEHFMEGGLWTRDDCLRILWDTNDSKGLWNHEFLSVLLDSTALRTEVARAQRALRVCQITIGRLLVGQADGQRALVGEIRETWKAHPLEGDLVEQNTRTHTLTPAGNLVSRAAPFVKVFQGIPKP